MQCLATMYNLHSLSPTVPQAGLHTENIAKYNTQCEAMREKYNVSQHNLLSINSVQQALYMVVMQRVGQFPGKSIINLLKAIPKKDR